MQASTFILGTGSGFRLRRPLAVSNGFVTDIDPRVSDQLDTLHGLLSAELFAKAALGGSGTPIPTPEFETDAEALLDDALGPPEPEPEPAARSRSGKASDEPLGGLDPALVLPDPLTPQRAHSTRKWAEGSLAADLQKQLSELEKAGMIDPSTGMGSPDLISLTEYVDRISDLSTLKYSVDDALTVEWSTYPETLRRVLDNDTYPALRVYLVAYAFTVLDLRDVGAVKKFILNDSLGAQGLIDYATIGAARDLVFDRGFSITDLDVDTGRFVAKVRAAGIGMSTASFEPDVMAVVSDLINDVEHKELIDKAEKTLGPLSLATRQLLARYIDAAPVTITTTNITAFATSWLAQITPPPAISPSDPTITPTDADFSIETFQDDPSSLTISRSAVLCSAQLYYTMVLGDELDVFSIVHYFTHKYLVNGLMEVTDPVLRTDLQNYVFSNRFTDLRTGQLADRSRPAERGMFYRQVFALGHGQVPEDLIVNDDFPSMWKTLMFQSATYLEKAQASLNPDGFVSKQQVMQSVEDLQYNLSTHCIGMATVATPLMHAELNFAVRRILMHPEVLRQVVPVGGTWWRVVERLYMDLKQTRPRSTALYNKAKLGHDIIATIADYNPATFEDDTNFSAFISNVDAYITTQSILQAALTDDLKRRQEDTPVTVVGAGPPTDGSGDVPGAPGQSMGPGGLPMPAGAMPPTPPTPMTSPAPMPVGAGATNGASANGHAPSDEWDF